MASSAKHTAVIVEPRYLERIPAILEHYRTTLGSEWKIVFYCGRGLKAQWGLLVSSEIEIRELDVSTMSPVEYSEFFKRKELWTSLEGEYVLVFEANSWIINKEPCTIDYFINMNHSYIGANMSYMWHSLIRDKLYDSDKMRNYCGGLSLRRRRDMIRILDEFPPEPTYTTPSESPRHTTDPEDIYFVLGCYKLKLSIGDDSKCREFAMHSYPCSQFFGIYSPDIPLKMHINNIYPDISKIAYFN